VEILESIIKNLSEECSECRWEPVREGKMGEFGTVGYFDEPFEKCLRKSSDPAAKSNENA